MANSFEHFSEIGGARMHIECVEIQNFKKLKSCRVEFTDKTTIFVGANNSGKTSAMDALRKFLDKKSDFTINDFTLSNWIEINRIGERWLSNCEETTDFEDLEKLIPTLDVWLQVSENEIHYVTHLIPSLDWDGGLLGVRLRLEPKDNEYLYKDFVESISSAKETLSAAKSASSFSLWPRNLKDYLNKKFNTHFTVRAYILDPSKLLNIDPESGLARPQILPFDSDAVDEDPFKKLFLVHYIGAQRGFSDSAKTSEEDESTSALVGNLSTQLRRYYNTHLNPTESPDPTDIDALQAIESAQDIFDSKLRDGFENALIELQSLGYPGFSDPKITISTKFKPIDGLKHSSAVQFDLMPENKQFKEMHLRLPEQYNGLGYQNLISIIFKMMQFRDEWMKVGKLAKSTPSNKNDFFIPPLHIVLVEEPEAHLHIQVQQVFIRHVYDILCNNNRLKGQDFFKTQLIVSTHSGHIAHEIPFSSLRYFRKQSSVSDNEVPISTVVNLSNVFGENNATERFVTRYLQITHFDLLFADAAILVEGPAERMLIPHFIRRHFNVLNQKYISLLEIGGSHAHTLKPLIEGLGLTSLIITDLDSTDSKSKLAKPPLRNKRYITGNDTLKSWVPCRTEIDELFDLKCNEKVKRYQNANFSIRVAYQYPIKVLMVHDESEVEALPYTFEDALVFENLTLFKSLEGTGLIKKFKNAITKKKTIADLGKQFFDDLRNGKKAEFALQLICLEDLKDLKVPKYINEGLTWLEDQLQKKQLDSTIHQNSVDILVEEMVMN